MRPAIMKTALRRVLGRPWLLVGLWLLSLVSAAAAALPSGLLLSHELGHRLLAAPLARGQADYLWAELLSPGSPLLLSMLAAGGLALLLHWLLSSALSGGITAALLRPGHPAYAPPGRLLDGVGRSAWAMVRLELLGALLLRLPLLGLLLAGGFLLSHNQALGESTTLLLLLRFGPLAATGLWLWSTASLLLHLGRVHYLTQPAASRGALSALVAAWQQLRERPRMVATLLRLGLVAAALTAGLLVVGRLLCARLDYALLVGSAFAVRQLCALLRATLSLTLIAAAAEVWHHQGE